MIRYYLLNNNEMYYSVKIQTFLPTKHTLVGREQQVGRLIFLAATRSARLGHQNTNNVSLPSLAGTDDNIRI